MVKRFLCLLSMVVMTFSVFIVGNGEGSVLRPNMDLNRADASFWGENADDLSGNFVGCAGDVNGDGYDDILIGSYANDEGGNNAGQTYLILGKATGWTMDTDLSQASASFLGEAANDFSGCSVAGVGDVNGDGFDDLMIGAYGDDDGGSQAGQSYLILGRSSGWSMDTDLSSASASFRGEAVSDYSGLPVAGVGDVNGDGYDDILIGAFGNNDLGTDTGQTYLVLGKASGWAMDTSLSSVSASFRGEGVGDCSGLSVAGAGDVNGDGYDDMIIGAPYNGEGGVTGRGQTYLILGKASGWAMDTSLSTSSASFQGENANDDAGYRLSGAGDINGDGFDDFMIGAYMNDEGGSAAGQTYIIFGKASGWSMDTSLSGASASFLGEMANDFSSSALAGARDVNGDGYDDILIGAPGNDNGGLLAGKTYLIHGKATGWAMDVPLTGASASFMGEDYGDSLGDSATGVGDVNGDGMDDILIGAADDEDGGIDAGQTYLILSGVGPPAPRNLRYSLSSTSTRITLNWDAPTSWAEPLEAYRIHRSTNGMDYQYLGFTSTSTRTYADSAVSIGVTYHYMIIADYDEGTDISGKAYLTVVCDLDTDGDGIGNMADWGDDDDKVADHSDAFPLDSTEWLDTDLDGEGNEADKDDDNDGIGDTDDPEPLNPLNGVKLDLASMHTDLIQTKDEITLMLEGIGYDLEDINDTFLQRIDDLDLKISAQIYQLGLLMESVNASIRSQVTLLDSDLTAFRSDMNEGLGTITASLDEDQIEMMNELDTISDQIDTMSISLEGVNVSILDSLEGVLMAISTELSEGDENLSLEIGTLLQRIGEYRSDTNGRVQNVSDLMATMQGLQDLSDTADRIDTDLEALNALQTGVGDIQKEQEDTTSSISLNTILLIVAIVLQMVLLIIGAMLLMRRRDKESLLNE